MATSAHRHGGKRLRRLMALLVLLAPPAAALPLAEISVVNADGSASDNSYELFYAAYGSNAGEDQNCDGSHSDFGRHIVELDDELLHNPVFEFLIHLQQDIDCSTGKDDRQRMAVKVNSTSADSLKAVDGERHH